MTEPSWAAKATTVTRVTTVLKRSKEFWRVLKSVLKGFVSFLLRTSRWPLNEIQQVSFLSTSHSDSPWLAVACRGLGRFPLERALKVPDSGTRFSQKGTHNWAQLGTAWAVGTARAKDLASVASSVSHGLTSSRAHGLTPTPYHNANCPVQSEPTHLVVRRWGRAAYGCVLPLALDVVPQKWWKMTRPLMGPSQLETTEKNGVRPFCVPSLICRISIVYSIGRRDIEHIENRSNWGQSLSNNCNIHKIYMIIQ